MFLPVLQVVSRNVAHKSHLGPESCDEMKRYFSPAPGPSTVAVPCATGSIEHARAQNTVKSRDFVHARSQNVHVKAQNAVILRDFVHASLQTSCFQIFAWITGALVVFTGLVPKTATLGKF